MVFAVVTGGGTSGHVLPALAVLEALVDAGESTDDVKYVGSRRGVERSMMADSGFECAFLPISGLQRSLSPRAIFANAALSWRVPISRARARRLIRAWRPRVVVSVGGYASDPMSRAAVSEGVPLVCVSYDRTPGLATRRQARHAAVCAVAFEGSALPRAVHTGAPVRREIIALDIGARRNDARRALGLPEGAKVLTIVGGSLGSAVLNGLVPQIAARLADRNGDRFAIYHVCGERNLSTPVPDVPPNVWYRRVGYASNMVDVYAATDLLVCRAGASTIAEIATMGIASVIVPWSGSAEGHQELNAHWLGDDGAAIVMDEASCATPESIEQIVVTLSSSVARERLASAARRKGEVHRGGSLVRAIRDAAR